jgi:hypothetical protein
METTETVKTVDPATLPQKRFAGELLMTFEDAVRLLGSDGPAKPPLPATPGEFLRSLLGRGKKSLWTGGVGQDGFYLDLFDDKIERERRYGEVYRLREEKNGYFFELEFPRRVPASAAREKLGVSEEMPDYDYKLELQDRYFTVVGRLRDLKLRRLAAASAGFPPDFTTRIELPERVAGFCHRLHEKTLEVALPRKLPVGQAVR